MHQIDDRNEMNNILKKMIKAVSTIITSRVSQSLLQKLIRFGGRISLLWHHIKVELADETTNEMEQGDRFMRMFKIFMKNHEIFTEFMMKFEMDCDLSGITKNNRRRFLTSLSAAQQV